MLWVYSKAYTLCVMGITQGLCVKLGEWPLHYYQPFLPHLCVKVIGTSCDMLICENSQGVYHYKDMIVQILLTSLFS